MAGNIGNRGNWERTFDAGVVKGAARRREQHHAARHSYWRLQLKDAEARAAEERKELGIEGDPLTFQIAGTSNYGGIVNANEQRINACKGKVSEHESRMLEYRRYAAFLSGGPDQVALTMDDYVFFGLDEREGEEQKHER